MFRIPEMHIEEMDFDAAVEMLKRRGNGDLLAGMEEMNNIWDEYVESSHTDDTLFDSDDDFFATWRYECSAYNVVHERMAPLFQGLK